jgi:hypothetical protein
MGGANVTYGGGGDIYRVYLKCFGKLQERVLHKKKKKNYINICPEMNGF